MASSERCQSCSSTIEQPASGRRRRFCSRDCRIRAFRSRVSLQDAPRGITGHSADCNAPAAFPAKIAHFVTSEIKDLATSSKPPSTIYRGGIVAPRRVIEAVIGSRDWQEVVSAGGVVSYVSRISKPALQPRKEDQDVIA
jgi:hypothetical protein